MVATEARLTAEQFMAMPEVEGIKRELIDGEVLEMASGGPPHETVKARGGVELSWYVKDRRLSALVCLETRFYLGEYRNPQPDVAIVLSGELDPSDSGKITAVPTSCWRWRGRSLFATCSARSRCTNEPGCVPSSSPTPKTPAWKSTPADPFVTFHWVTPWEYRISCPDFPCRCRSSSRVCGCRLPGGRIESWSQQKPG